MVGRVIMPKDVQILIPALGLQSPCFEPKILKLEGKIKAISSMFRQVRCLVLLPETRWYL